MKRGKKKKERKKKRLGSNRKKQKKKVEQEREQRKREVKINQKGIKRKKQKQNQIRREINLKKRKNGMRIASKLLSRFGPFLLPLKRKEVNINVVMETVITFPYFLSQPTYAAM